MSWKKYRKLPVVIDALLLEDEKIIETLEGDMRGDVGDYLIRGVQGELYPCKPDIFKATYELVEE